MILIRMNDKEKDQERKIDEKIQFNKSELNQKRKEKDKERIGSRDKFYKMIDKIFASPQ